MVRVVTAQYYFLLAKLPNLTANYFSMQKISIIQKAEVPMVVIEGNQGSYQQTVSSLEPSIYQFEKVALLAAAQKKRLGSIPQFFGR